MRVDQLRAFIEFLECDGVAIGLEAIVRADHAARPRPIHLSDEVRRFTPWYLDPSALRRRYRRAQKVAELRRLRLHDLRHTFGSPAVRGGVDLATLERWMGHSRISTTERYLHAKPRTDDAARLDRAFEGGLAELERTAPAAG